jgi:hypothetical protein
MEKEKIRPLYAEFQGYLSQTPEPRSPGDTMSGDESLWDQYNNSVDLLNNITREDFNRFKIEPRRGQSGKFILIVSYRRKLGGLISHLHGRYFSDEPAPFSGMPSTVITQTQHQNQTVQMLFEIRDKIEAKMADYQEGTKERKFLQKFKESLASISNWTQLLSQLLKMAKILVLILIAFQKFSPEKIGKKSRGSFFCVFGSWRWLAVIAPSQVS